tara:strand:- start:118374 stop:119156 length:783 start_codon:yes stop_codon:yes gene_type:complete
MSNKRTTITTLTMLGMCAGFTTGAERDVQFTIIIPESRQIVIDNTGSDPIDLSGWRFCTHNTSVVRRYTSPDGFDGITIDPNANLVLHLNNDAPAELDNHINVADLGGSFADFEFDAFAMGLYFPGTGGNVSFGNGDTIADHVQWSLFGLNNFTADDRTDEAVAGGVWTAVDDWIAVRPDTVLIELNDPTFAELHGPMDYRVFNACPADLNGDGVLNFFDVSAFLSAFSAMDPAADFSGDGMFTFFDVSQFLSAFNAGCP